MKEKKITSMADAIRQRVNSSKQKIEKNIGNELSTRGSKGKSRGIVDSVKKCTVADAECVRLTLRLPEEKHLLLQFIGDGGISINKLAVYALSKLLEEEEIQDLIQQKLKRIAP